jgi:hypothetical protein
MLGHGYNGIDFFDDIATINSTFADSVSTGINGSMQFLKFNHIADLGEEAQAFQNCVSLKQVYLGHGSISDNRILLPAHCFDGCKNLYYFGLANDARITSIGLEAFSQCASFTNREMFHVSQDNLGNIGTWVDSSDGKGS